jgi:hypothetical protein
MNGQLSDRPADGAASSAGAVRMARHRSRRRRGVKWIDIELRETEIDALIRRRRLDPDGRGDLAAVRRALYGFLEDTLR